MSGKASFSHFCFCLNYLKMYQSLLEKGEKRRELQVICHQRYGGGIDQPLRGSVSQQSSTLIFLMLCPAADITLC